MNDEPKDFLSPQDKRILANDSIDAASESLAISNQSQSRQNLVEYLQKLLDETDLPSEEVELEELDLLTDDPLLWADPTPEELAFFDADFDTRVYNRVMAFIQQKTNRGPEPKETR